MVAAAAEETEDNAPVLLPLADGRLLTLPARQVVPILAALVELFAGRTGAEGEGGRFGFARTEAADLAWLEERRAPRCRGRGAAAARAAAARGRRCHPAGAAACGFRRHAAALPGAGRRLAAVPARRRARRRAGRRHGPRQDGADPGTSRGGAGGGAARPAGAGGLPDQPGAELAARGGALRPPLSVLSLHGPSRKQRFADIPRQTGHHHLSSARPRPCGADRAGLARGGAGQAQTIKNPNAETTRQALRLKARQRLCLSGTPLQNHLGELWSLFDFLSPGFLGSPSAFRSRYRTPIEKTATPSGKRSWRGAPAAHGETHRPLNALQRLAELARGSVAIGGQSAKTASSTSSNTSDPSTRPVGTYLARMMRPLSCSSERRPPGISNGACPAASV